jgi:hypothetical protein
VLRRAACPPHRGNSWSHHQSPQALDVDLNAIRKYKEAGAPKSPPQGTERRPRPGGYPKKRGQGHYKGQPGILEEPQQEQHHYDYHHDDYHRTDHPSPPPPDGFPRQAW